MPTYEVADSFWRDWDELRPDQRAAFQRAVRDEFIPALTRSEESAFAKRPMFKKRLGVTPMRGKRQVMEFAWAPDGRATWRYGPRRAEGKYHIVWRHIGTHRIYDEELRTKD